MKVEKGEGGESADLKALRDGTVAVKGLPATVDLVEPLGAETIVHAVLDQRKTPMIARVPGDASVRHGERVLMVPDMETAVYFKD